MDYVICMIIDLILEEGVSASKSNKLPKGIRYFLFTLVLILYIGIIGLITIIGISLLEDNNIVEGILTFLFALCILILSIFRFRAVYKDKIQKNKQI